VTTPTPDRKPTPEGQDEESERLKRLTFGSASGRGLGALVLAAGFAGAGVLGLGELPYRILGIAVGGLVIIGGLHLFYDIPLRRLGRVSKGFLYVWIAASALLFIYSLFRRF
jgi:hypothetical protein